MIENELEYWKKYETPLARAAETSSNEDLANRCMAKLRELNHTYHWCVEWDYMVICDKDKEYELCICEK